ncbi:MAG TPA: methylated-DNA--[protein]-cysteine S-methyltransferase [Phenylobacterium sp.]|jgi:methylated-DNA-[protein]-cysteine S-methyltransferase|nr:methylated-DNA--[protein]-cysteine S-methyltransferase [Phenylobacterium sp.]
MTDAQPERLTLERMPTPIGEALIVTDEAGRLRAFNWQDYEDRMLHWLGRHYPRTPMREGRSAAAVHDAFERYFAGDARALDGLAWRARGTPFQLQVWEALCTIPAGETLSYAGLAARIGRPSAVRAVGLANGANPISVLVPCHRVIGADGSLTGYGGGLSRKQWLLAHEGARLKSQMAA